MCALTFFGVKMRRRINFLIIIAPPQTSICVEGFFAQSSATYLNHKTCADSILTYVRNSLNKPWEKVRSYYCGGCPAYTAVDASLFYAVLVDKLDLQALFHPVPAEIVQSLKAIVCHMVPAYRRSLSWLSHEWIHKARSTQIGFPPTIIVYKLAKD